MKGVCCMEDSMAEQLINNRAELLRLTFDRQVLALAQGESRLLTYLARAGDSRPGPGDISRDIGVSTARVAALLHGLEQKALARRIPDAGDGRRETVELTEKGRAAVGILRQQAQRLAATLLEAVGPEAAGEYLRIQQKMIAFLKEERRRMLE